MIISSNSVVNDIIWLRSIAIFAGLSMITFNYFHPFGRPLWLPLKWNVFFILTNTAYVLYLLNEQEQAKRLTEEQISVFKTVFEPVGVSRVSFKKLLKKSSVSEFPPGENLTTEGTLSTAVMVMISGKADVTVQGEKIYEVHPGQFIGENGLHCGLMFANGINSTATVKAVELTKCLVWKRGSLIDLLEDDESLARSMQQAMATDLLRKMHRGSEAHLSERSARKLHLKQEGLYFSLLRQALASGRITDHERQNLERFRLLHDVSLSDHTEYLAKLEWTVEEYTEGVKASLKTKPGDIDAEMEQRFRRALE
jgi:CRP-like cAMP-binding protein